MTLALSELYQEFLQLLFELVDREEEEAQQLPDIARPTEAEEASSLQKGLLQDLAHLSGRYDNLLHEVNREDLASHRKTFSQSMLTCLEILDTNSIQKNEKSSLRIYASNFRMVTCCERFMILTDCYELFRSHLQ